MSHIPLKFVNYPHQKSLFISKVAPIINKKRAIIVGNDVKPNWNWIKRTFSDEKKEEKQEKGKDKKFEKVLWFARSYLYMLYLRFFHDWHAKLSLSSKICSLGLAHNTVKHHVKALSFLRNFPLVRIRVFLSPTFPRSIFEAPKFLPRIFKTRSALESSRSIPKMHPLSEAWIENLAKIQETHFAH